jgi:hypothetical protein
MTRPGTTVKELDAPRRRVTPTDTATWFPVGISERGPIVPTEVRSMADVTGLFGTRVSYGILYDSLDAFFGERGGLAIVSRVVGSGAVPATHTFNDSVAAASLRVDAANPGDWANARLTVQVAAGVAAGTFVLIVAFDGAEVDRSPDLLDLQAAVDWASGSDWIRATALGVNDPAVAAATALAGGSDDRANIADAHWQTALDRYTSALGPGQVSMPGRYSLVARTALLTHARDRNRFALMDGDPNASRSTLVTNAAALRALGTDLARHGQTFARWGVAAGLTPGATRQIPYSAVQAGMVARNDATGPAGRPVAGDNATSLFLNDLSANGAAWTDADLDALADGGITVPRNFDGVIQTYDNITLVDQVLDEKWLDASTARLAMDIAAQGGVIGDRHMFRLIDGQGFELSDFRNDLGGMLERKWLDREIYGLTAADAFAVDVGPPVNTVDTIAARKLRANIAFKPSRGARTVEIQIGNTPLTEAL